MTHLTVEEIIEFVSFDKLTQKRWLYQLKLMNTFGLA